ncbi:hypothetical protein H4S08_003164 [Coemansia sp. RSA 1365]|nr:hypothetical protein H4S08_003164 [Coemansia sp. RSA 1365]
MSKYTHINLSFAIPEEDGTITFDKELSIPETVKDIHSKGPKVLVSVGGWTGSKKISSIIADKTKSAKFTSQIIELVKTNKLDGIDIDWEYPGKLGLECNKIDYENDTPNFLVFIKQLRSKFNTEFGKDKKLITMAVGMEPFHIDKKPSTDVGEFAKYVDFASIMAFDVNGGWSKTTGPNAPLNNEDGKGDAFSVASAIKSWTGAKWPANKLLIGLAFYGRALTATKDLPKSQASMYQPKEKEIPQGDWEDAKETADAACGVEGTYTGQWLYQHLRQSALTGPDKAHKDWIRNWDKVSKTPWLFNPKNKTLITYDDPPSITAKVKFASGKGLAGAMVWAIDKDYKGELVTAMHSWPGSTSGDNTPDNTDNEGSGKEGSDNEGSGKDDTGSDNEGSGKDDTGKDDTDNEGSGKDDTGKDDTGNDDTGNEDSAVRLERDGFGKEQAASIVESVNTVLGESTESILSNIVTKAEQDKTLYMYKVDFAQLKSEIQMMEKTDFSMMKAENERLQGEVNKLKQKLREEITRTQAGVRLDMSLEKGRARDEQAQHEIKIRETDAKIEQEISGLRTQMESIKFSILQYMIGTITGTGALILAYLRMFK